VDNVASGLWSTIGGGVANRVSGKAATVGGGIINTASGDRATVGGGCANEASGYGAVVGGGCPEVDYYIWLNNRASGNYSTVNGGVGNTASGGSATIGGGEGNTASGYASVIGGGGGVGLLGNPITNTASAPWSTIGGGEYNTASGFDATVGGGAANTASGWDATVGGGVANTANGDYATVPGGNWNTAQGDYSFAAGRRAKANHDGTFVWGDSTDADVASTKTDQFVIRAGNGVFLTENLHGGPTVTLGERYRDNAIVAWGSVWGTTGAIDRDFGVNSVTRNGAGNYTINLDISAMDGSSVIPIAIAEIDSAPNSAATVRLVSIDQKGASTFNVYINDGNWNLVDNDFVFIVTAR
jgi:hypothetical protein